jgi:hypothetical protein
MKQKVEESGWLDGTRLTFASIYLEDNPDAVPFGLLLKGEEALVQIRRKFYYPLEVVGEALAEAAVKLGSLPQKPVFQIVIDPDYEWQTTACLVWNRTVIVNVSERASDFWFESADDAADFLAEIYQEGIAQLQSLLSDTSAHQT